MSSKKYSHNAYRSFFWPVILIGVGVIWLLSNLNLIPGDNLWILIRLLWRDWMCFLPAD